ncbi:hypothetical protein GCM10010124_05420 [Pilimelia terevasa]|uniref:Uncharacterized protein n=2 Tax=Pilimelia terevasa TaxID=53372 RepID=A0A8J3BJM5_9ACTN|nr:hypothetical protein GCM10010124_05420 [Pilimelia terevasa]
MLTMGCVAPADQAAPGGPTGGASTGPSATPTANTPAARAAALVAGWRAGPGPGAWRGGFVPLEGLSVPPPNVAFTPATRAAFDAGRYTFTGALPSAAPVQRDKITFHQGGVQDVDVVPAAEAYRQLSTGGSPDCGTFDKAVLPESPAPCQPLTITGVRYGLVDLRTSRGTAAVPAWRFTVTELGGEVARVAVAPSAVTAVPEVPTGPPPAELMPVAQVVAIDGAQVTYLAEGTACDRDVRPFVAQEADVVVLGATATRGSGTCSRQLVTHRVTGTLTQALAERAVLDAHSGRLLTPGRRVG